MRALLLVSMIALAPAAAMATEINQVVSSTQVTLGVVPATAVPASGLPQQRSYERVINVGTPGSGVAWCSRYDTSPAPNKAGSFPIAPYGDTLGRPSSEEFNMPGFVPQQALNCIADQGTATLSGEVLP